MVVKKHTKKTRRDEQKPSPSRISPKIESLDHQLLGGQYREIFCSRSTVSVDQSTMLQCF